MSNVPPRFRAIRNESSGDPLADRRFAYAEACRAEGDLAAADDLYRQTLERVPDWLPALAGLAQVLHEQGREAEALAIARAGLAADPADRMGLALFLAERGEAAEGAIRPGYLAALFDAYADGFDAHLTGALGYVAPGYLAQRLAPDPAARFTRALDLGCGTGLMGRARAGRAATLIGVDLSEGMLAKARATGHYQRLEAGDLVAFLDAEPAGSADLAVAADVFAYLGDLRPALAAAFHALAPGGRLVFTIQTRDGEGYSLGADRRFHHAPAVVRAWAEEAGFAVEDWAEASFRLDRGVPVAGAYFRLAKA